ncbi:high affinity choline transporter 1-like isoform X2 [Gouania willdenowi]|uniref:high affinity choline transporter 1-like isoform X2 n=1 Tax=Gouania willdenowi TaxID=441366 RepID=UPI001055A067|nr:high affinity choline transporter 1-like isoform X2 [Gouania willdenowi]
MAANWLGLVAIGVFYIIILVTGIWASWKSKHEEKKSPGSLSEVTMVGGRNLNTWVSIFTMTGGVALVKPIRSKKYVTLMDPFQEKYGNTVGAVLFIPVIIGDILWIACILSALGGTVSVIMDIPSTLSVGISAAVAIIYTAIGGLYSVAYTDVIQLCFMLVGLWLCVPFVLASPHAANLTVAAVTKLYQDPWIGKLDLENSGRWIDELLLLSIGGICYQSFYQRVLSTATDAQAKITCYAGAVLCPILGIPSLIVGAVAASTNWNQTSFGSPSPYEQGKAGQILPITLQHLCPFYISMIGIGALTASVMSSADSVLLSAASQLGRNIFKNLIYKRASEKSILVVVKVSVFLCGLIGAGLAMTSNSVHLFWIISADVLYSMMTAQVLCTFFLPQYVNQYGVCFGFVFAILVRALVGEPLIGLPDILPLPLDKIQEDGRRHRLLPFRTIIMILTVGTIVLVSQVAERLPKKRPLQMAINAETDGIACNMEIIEDDVNEKDNLQNKAIEKD